jgi:hypothetical protein
LGVLLLLRKTTLQEGEELREHKMSIDVSETHYVICIYVKTERRTKAYKNNWAQEAKTYRKI